jgi:hypothetical protein
MNSTPLAKAMGTSICGGSCVGKTTPGMAGGREGVVPEPEVVAGSSASAISSGCSDAFSPQEAIVRTRQAATSSGNNNRALGRSDKEIGTVPYSRSAAIQA